MVVKFEEAADFYKPGGLQSNGSVLVYYGEHEKEGTPYELKSIAWRLLEDVGVGIAAFNTPSNMNCLAPNCLMEMFLVLDHAKRDPKVKSLVWTGAGDKAFNAGGATKGDMKIHVPKDIVRAYQARGIGPVKGDLICAPHTRAFWDFPKPLVVAVNGLAIGAGANIALANLADMVVVSKTARFMWPFAKLGATPELGSSMMLPWICGMANAKRLLMAGEWLSAKEALRMNLVGELCEPEQLLPRAIEQAAKVATYNPETTRLIKQLLNAPLRAQLDAVLLAEQNTIEKSVQAQGSGDGRGAPVLLKVTPKSKL